MRTRAALLVGIAVALTAYIALAGPAGPLWRGLASEPKFKFAEVAYDAGTGEILAVSYQNTTAPFLGWLVWGREHADAPYCLPEGFMRPGSIDRSRHFVDPATGELVVDGRRLKPLKVASVEKSAG